MQFYEKLNYLMKLTQITNKELAAEMAVDRSLISVLRNGKRGMPRNVLHIRHMAQCFANRITADFQRQALVEITGLPLFRTEVPADILAIQLERWLIGEMDIVENIVEGLGHREDNKKVSDITKHITAPVDKTVFYYGEEGRKQALLHLFKVLGDGPVGVDDTTGLNWIASDYAFSSDVQSLVKKHLKKGNIITHIIPSLDNLPEYTSSLRFMLPIYASGQTNVLYYPRIQGSYITHTSIVAPGQCVLISCGINHGNSDIVSFVSTDKELVNAHAEQFREFLSMCRPALIYHKDPADFPSTLIKVLSSEGGIYLKTAPLSVTSMPGEVAQYALDRSISPVWIDEFSQIIQIIPKIENALKNKVTFFDISRLDSAEDVRAGRVAIACPYLPSKDHPCYTPETYILHLKNILRLMDTYENYFFLPIDADKWPGYNLVVNESGMALLLNSEAPPAIMLELRRPEIILACKEHIIRLAEKEGCSDIHREKIRLKIKSLINELKKS